MDVTLTITEGLHCASCVRRLQTTLAPLPGVTAVRVDLTARRAVVSTASGGPSPATLIETLSRHGFSGELATTVVPSSRPAWIRAGVAVLLAGLTFDLPLLLPHASAHAAATAAAAVALLWPGWILVRSAVSAAGQRTASMDTLIVLGGVAALLVGEGHATAVTVALTLIGRAIEARARQATASAIEGLALRVPEQVLRLNASGAEEHVALSEIHVGDRLRLHAGTQVPVDGTLVAGDLAVDEALLTGESLPVAKVVGEEVAGGTRVVDGTAIVAATRIGADTAVARLASLVHAAAIGKPSVQRVVDAIAAVFVPLVIGLALATWAGWWWHSGSPLAGVLAAAAVLVIACPCALGLATPTALVAASGAAARRGIFILTPRALEAAARITAVAFDKTGTLTTGAFTIERIYGEDQARVLAVAAAVEQGSDHPLALAIRCAHLERAIAPSRGIVQEVRRYTQRAGAGATADIDGGEAIVGSAEWLREHRVEPLAMPDPGSSTVVHVAQAGVAVGAIMLRDADREEAPAAIAELAKTCRVLLISGDRAGPATAAGTRLGVDEVAAQCTPAMKLTHLRRLQGEGLRVAFVGDGLNDAPALAAADLGITVGRANEVAAAAGDLLLPTGDLAGVPWVLRLARRTRRVVFGNLLLAAGYNLVALPFAAFGYVDPALAAGAMVLSSLAVVGNSLRLTR
jgi:heavy metal translocating P-type ATPase